MRTISDLTRDRFIEATLSDDDLGYPEEVAFVPSDQDWADEVAWRYLARERRPIVIASEEFEFFLVPARRTLRDRLGGHVRVNVKYRTHGHSAELATSSTLGRTPVREMRDLAAIG